VLVAEPALVFVAESASDSADHSQNVAVPESGRPSDSDLALLVAREDRPTTPVYRAGISCPESYDRGSLDPIQSCYERNRNYHDVGL
jgi:hypothetical protein